MFCFFFMVWAYRPFIHLYKREFELTLIRAARYITLSTLLLTYFTPSHWLMSTEVSSTKLAHMWNQTLHLFPKDLSSYYFSSAALQQRILRGFYSHKPPITYSKPLLHLCILRRLTDRRGLFSIRSLNNSVLQWEETIATQTRTPHWPVNKKPFRLRGL